MNFANMRYNDNVVIVTKTIANDLQIMSEETEKKPSAKDSN